ncbi:MAG: EAL domain-containing protein [Gammaproteobacteria bacterium]|nr:EAL domain-containing protein [Gammaproteobacteria bacterium]
MNYQPQIDIKTGDVIGVEALMRWSHERYGIIRPQEYIEIAERSGLIHSLTYFVLDTALSQTGQWLRDGLDLKVSINLSVRNLQDARLSEVIEAMLSKHRVPPENLLLESLHKMGISTSIDDFGTGYSSLKYIKDLPITEIKIDRSFVMDMICDGKSRSIVQSIIVLAQSLNLHVVAEGVETQSIVDELASMGCDTAQGYHYAKPLASYSVADWVRSRSQPNDNVNSISKKLVRKI